ncbi:hypothetical protein J3E69DRAFT_323138 [Trichoderma sp. SZMC 28015]
MRGCDGNRHASERSGDKAWVHSERNALERLHHQRPRFACVTSFGRTNESDEADKPEKGKLAVGAQIGTIGLGLGSMAWTLDHWLRPLSSAFCVLGFFWGTLLTLTTSLFLAPTCSDGVMAASTSSSSSSRQAQWPLICHFTPPTWTLALQRAAAGMRGERRRGNEAQWRDEALTA